MFFIKHGPTNMLLFMGRVACPDPKQCRDASNSHASNSHARKDFAGVTDLAARGRAHCQGITCEDEVIDHSVTENGEPWTETPPDYSIASISEPGTQWNVLLVVWEMSYLGYFVYN